MEAYTDWTLARSFKAVIPCGISILIAFHSLTRHNQYPKATFLLIALFASIAFIFSNNFTSDGWINNIFARYQLIFIAHQSFLHCIASQDDLEQERRKGWNFGKGLFGYEKQISKQRRLEWSEAVRCEAKSGKQYAFAYKMLFNPLCSGTRWTVSRSNCSISPATTARSNLTFVIRRLGLLVFRYLALCLYYDPLFYFAVPVDPSLPPSTDELSPALKSLSPRLFSCFFSPSCSLTSPLILRAVALRFHWVLHFVLRDYLILSSYHDICSIIAVGLGLDDAEEWPAFYGNIADAYSVRRFWANFWHLLIYRSFSAHMAAMLKSLGLGGKGTSMRLLHNGLVFMASGLMHAMVDAVISHGSCTTCGCESNLWWYSVQVLGITTESVVLYTLKPYWSRNWVGGIIAKTAGFAWVLCWLAFVTEQTSFPYLYCEVSQS